MPDTSDSSYEPNIPLFGPCSVIVTGTSPSNLVLGNVLKVVGSSLPTPPDETIDESPVSCKLITFPVPCTFGLTISTQLSSHIKLLKAAVSRLSSVLSKLSPTTSPFSLNTW